MPNTYTKFTINNLDEFSFIAGDYQELYFDVYTSASTPIDITSASCLLVLSKYGDPSNVVAEFSGSPVVSGSVVNRYVVELEMNDTKELDGKYLYQPVVAPSAEVEYRPAQGVVTIVSRIPRSSE